MEFLAIILMVNLQFNSKYLLSSSIKKCFIKINYTSNRFILSNLITTKMPQLLQDIRNKESNNLNNKYEFFV